LIYCAGEGGVRAQTFLHWTGFDAAIKGTVFSGLAHVSDWGVTLVAALGFGVPHARPGQIPLDGMNLWPALTLPGAPSPRTEMLLSMRDAAGPVSCGKQTTQCTHHGQLAYRKGRMKLIYGHTALRGAGGAGDCDWTNHSKDGALSITCWNGWSKPYDLGPSRPPTPLPVRPGQPHGVDVYQYGSIFLYDIESDPLEEHELSASQPAVVAELLAALVRYNASQISQDTMPDGGAAASHEPCGGTDPESPHNPLSCSVPWLPSVPGHRCVAAPVPPPVPPAPPAPSPAPGGRLRSHLTGSKNWGLSASELSVHGWACYVGSTAPTVMLTVDGAAAAAVKAPGRSGGVCGAGQVFGSFSATLNATVGQDFTKGRHEVNGMVAPAGGEAAPLGDAPQCIEDGQAAEC
jgi:hypothetical protein